MRTDCFACLMAREPDEACPVCHGVGFIVQTIPTPLDRHAVRIADNLLGEITDLLSAATGISHPAVAAARRYIDGARCALAELPQGIVLERER